MEILQQMQQVERDFTEEEEAHTRLKCELHTPSLYISLRFENKELTEMTTETVHLGIKGLSIRSGVTADVISEIWILVVGQCFHIWKMVL